MCRREPDCWGYPAEASADVRNPEELVGTGTKYVTLNEGSSPGISCS